jgi:hypothetical protein
MPAASLMPGCSADVPRGNSVLKEQIKIPVRY